MLEEDYLDINEFAEKLMLEANGVQRMKREGTVPVEDNLYKKNPVWLEKNLEDWFSHLHHGQSAYAPAKTALGTADLRALNAYICPVSTGGADRAGWISNRRPYYLALTVHGNDALEVYEVLWAETQKGIMGEEVITHYGDQNGGSYKAPWDKVYNNGRSEDDGPYVYYQLGEKIGEFTVNQTIRRGGTVSTDSLIKAIRLGHAEAIRGGRVHFE